MENKFPSDSTASMGQICFKMLESITYEEYTFHKGQVISFQTLAILITYAEVNVVCCYIG